MAVNILLGVGGTGAKIVESALFLLSAGFGSDDEVHVGLVDQDNSNGNVVRTEDLLKLLTAIRRDFQEGANRIDWTRAGRDRVDLFSIGLRPLMESGAHWRPAADDLPTLRAIMRHEQMPADEKDLFDLLFRGDAATPGGEEQTMGLSEGYRGRAHVGAAALVCAVHYDSREFIERMVELMRRSSSGDEVRIFIAGSLFGGTGAAGFPTIARTLHRLRDGGDPRITGAKVSIAGALMLPYFAFSDPQDERANVVTSAQLLPQSRVAVEYYQRLLQQEHVFDRLYVSGWDTMFQLGYHEAGRGDQRNPPLPPELVAALGAADFFTLPLEAVRSDEPLVAARRERDAFGWQDLPVREDMRNELYERLGGALRFALWWRYRVEPAIDDRGMFGIRVGWLKRLAAGTDWEAGTRAVRDRLNDYSTSVLRWAAGMRLFGRDAVGDFALWNGERLWSTPPNPPSASIDLPAGRTEEETLRDLETLVMPIDRNGAPGGADAVYQDLNEPASDGAHEAFGRLVAGVHRATRPARGGAR